MYFNIGFVWKETFCVQKSVAKKCNSIQHSYK